jgi:hypothetical protein
MAAVTVILMAAVAAILNEQQCWSSKGTFLQYLFTPNKAQKNKGTVDPGVCRHLG